ncbi:MAG: 3-dehydroquinate synthase II [Methanomicrobiales archaeon]|nr:3-dehydroquinate synthase II [Methanomicrobiales archaeon]
MSSQKIIWIRADLASNYEEEKKILSSALEAGFENIVIRKGDSDLKKLARFNAIECDGNEFFLEGKKIGESVTISTDEDLKRAYDLIDSVEYLVTISENWKIIPLENLITQIQSSQTKLLPVCETPEEAKLFFETMEKGSDGVVVSLKTSLDLFPFSKLLTDTVPKIELTLAEVVDIKVLSLGDRTCVDTCSIFHFGEGMLVGSQSSCLFLIGSECMESEYVASRPFRVNAGAVHSYALCADGNTKYLSELKSGDEVMAIDSNGNGRVVTVGRVKTEIRPMVMISAMVNGCLHSVILQNAETIRLCSPGKMISVSELKIGDKVFVKTDAGGRHFGQKIEETIREA